LAGSKEGEEGEEEEVGTNETEDLQLYRCSLRVAGKTLVLV